MENTARNTVIVGVDGSPQSVSALRYAAQLSAKLDHDLVAFTSWLPRIALEDYTPEWAPEQDARDALEATITEAFGEHVPAQLGRQVIMGPAAPNLIEASKSAALLVLGTRGRGGFKGLVMGSVSSSLAAHAKCPVLIHHGEDSTV
ncbi:MULTISPECIES: universal stress protein [Paeniglutamicibacter]|jgi:nucleotide-binding universal stress UspA family protein|uniref:Universal stress protein n=1 Tax=Paeniglutamicibacter terrestris TaxID=2723403 RepID=A0ABX1G708_9MICC|nr:MULTISPECIES: universal stress protein [Paeniglutamicibacter]ASN40185.1 universal stress protein UspA [Arthrobacter sp. 7749]NKG21481.1 universal stress protein [Paeniglutamicibacter terrestris]QXQ11118.1 universal stress protein [Paeniglutamicibacter sp. Y32M11]